MRSPRFAFIAILVFLALGGLISTFVRSTIPLSFEGRVNEIEVVHEKEPGLDDVHLVTIGDETTHVDADVADLLDEGDRVEKGAWSRSIAVDGEELSLTTSRDFRLMLIVLPWTVVVGVLLLTRPAARAKRGPRVVHQPKVEGGDDV